MRRLARRGLADRRQRQLAVEAGGQPPVMADEEQRAARRQALASEQSEKGFLTLGVEGRGRFVGDDDLGTSDQRARRRYALLLADAQGG
jgi:hypothetical protein